MRRIVCKYLIILSDAVIMAAALYVAGVFFDGCNGPCGPVLSAGPAIIIPVFLAFLFISSSFVSGQYTRRQLIWDDARIIVKTLLVIAFIHVSLIGMEAAPGTVSTSLALWGCLAFLIPVGRLLSKRILRAVRLWQVPTMIVGCGDNALQASLTMQREPSLGYEVKAFVQIAENYPVHPDLDDARIVRLSGDKEQQSDEALDRLFSGHHVLIAPEDMADEGCLHVMDVLAARGYQIDAVPPLRGLSLLGMEISHLFGRELMILHTRNSLARPVRKAMKRCVDLVIASLALLLFLPLLAVVAYSIRREDKGPIFFAHSRTGYNGKDFPCLKFRTMRTDAEQMLAKWQAEDSEIWQEFVRNSFKLKDDPRITRIGHFLRATSLDELPQIINVLKGDMSIVGPRPRPRAELEGIGMSYLHYCRVRPGITGLWQVSGRSNTSQDERIVYDEWYIRNWSLWYDFVIILKTIPAVLKRDGAY